MLISPEEVYMYVCAYVCSSFEFPHKIHMLQTSPKNICCRFDPLRKYSFIINLFQRNKNI